MGFCNECGKELTPEAKFCNECGVQIVSEAEPLSEKAKVAQEKSKWFAALSNLMIPGLGYFYLNKGIGDPTLKKKGIIAICIAIVGLLTTPFIIGFFILGVLMIYLFYDCVTIIDSTRAVLNE